MVEKIISANQVKKGTNIIVDGKPCTVKNIDISKPGKHGSAKCRFEAVGIIDGQKKAKVLPGDDKVEVPRVEKNKAQVLSKADGKATIMDLESFENFEVDVPEQEVFDQLEEGGNCEYWDVEGEKIVKRSL